MRSAPKHDCYNPTSDALLQVNTLPLVDAKPRQESSTAEHTPHISTDPDVRIVAPSNSASQPQIPDAATSMMDGPASVAASAGNPLSLQLFIVSNEDTDARPDAALAHSANSYKRRRSSGVRRTLLAQLQVSSP